MFACSNEPSMAATPIQVQDLQQEWQLISIDNNSIEMLSSLSVNEQAKVSGNLACNNFFGSVELKENKMRIDKMGSTRKMCAPATNKVEMTVSSTLSAWSEVQLSKQKLILTGEKHTLIYKIK